MELLADVGIEEEEVVVVVVGNYVRTEPVSYSVNYKESVP
jgi:sulfur carrier protein ThiS